MVKVCLVFLFRSDTKQEEKSTWNSFLCGRFKPGSSNEVKYSFVIVQIATKILKLRGAELFHTIKLGKRCRVKSFSIELKLFITQNIGTVPVMIDTS